MRYEIPVLPGFHPDPTICRVGGTFYLATSSFEYVPGVPLYRSENLADWEPIGHALTRESQLAVHDTDASAGIYAPTLRYHFGTARCSNPLRYARVVVQIDRDRRLYVPAIPITG